MSDGTGETAVVVVGFDPSGTFQVVRTFLDEIFSSTLQKVILTYTRNDRRCVSTAAAVP